MNHEWNRRQIMRLGVMASAAVALPGLAGCSGKGGADAAGSAKWSYLSPGFTMLIARYIQNAKLAEKLGLSLAQPNEYTTVSTYYNDFAAEQYDICIGSWDTFAARYQAGVPLRYLCSISSAKMIMMVTRDPAVKSIEDIRGKTLAAAQSTGTYRMVSAIIRERYKLQLGSDIPVLSVDNPAAAMTIAMAGRASAGLSWEPNVTAAITREPSMRPFLNAADAYREIMGTDLPYFGVAIRKGWAEANPDKVALVRKMFQTAVSDIVTDPDRATGIAGDTGFPPEVISKAVQSGRLALQFASMVDAGEREALVKASAFFARNKVIDKPLDDGFFITQ
jgi:NitT/TauT family transport system substrate-binding protein